MFLGCAADDFRKFRKIRNIINLKKIIKKSVISKMSSVWCFFQVDYAGLQSPVLEFDKTALKTLIFFKKLIFAFLNPKIVNG